MVMICRRNTKIGFNTTRRNPEYEAFVDFYAGNEYAGSRSSPTKNEPLKMSIRY